MRMKLEDVDVLKVDVPSDATPETPWRVTRQSRLKYFWPVKPRRSQLDEPGGVGYRVQVDPHDVEPDSDIYAVRIDRVVAVTPLSLDLTSRVDFAVLKQALRTAAH
jgi:5'-nucleotidase